MPGKPDCERWVAWVELLSAMVQRVYPEAATGLAGRVAVGAALFRSNCAAVGGMRATANKSLWAWVKVSGMEAKGLVAAAPSRAEAWAS